MCLSVICRSCKGKFDIDVSMDKIFRWQEGEHIQRVMPELSASERELLISGICGECFDQLFEEEEEEEYDEQSDS